MDFSLYLLVFSLAGQTHGAIERMMKEWIHHKSTLSKGVAKQSEVRSIMKWSSNCVSTTIAKTSSGSS